MGDTNEITQGCLVHYDNQHLQVRKDFLSICSYDRAQFEEKPKEEPDQECMAKILRLLETLTDHLKTQWKLEAVKAQEKGLTIPPEPKEYPLELTYGAIGSLLAMQEPGYAAYGESTIRNSVAYLLRLDYIKRHQERKNSIPIYWLKIDDVQTKLKQKAEARLSGVEINSQRQVLKSTAKRPKSTADSLKSTAKRPKSTPPAVEINNNNKGNTNDTSEKEKESSVSSNDDNAPTSLSFKEKVRQKLTDPGLRAITEEMIASGTDNETTYHIDIPAIGNDTETRVFAGPLTLPSKGASHAAMVDTLPADCGSSTSVVSRGGIPASDGVQLLGRPERYTEVPADTQGGRQATTPLQVQPGQTQEITSPQAPGTGALPPSAESPQFGGSHGNTSVQATFVEPAQSSNSPAGIPPAQASGDGHQTTSNVGQETAKPALQASAAMANDPPPQMALTAKQIKAQNERRAKEIWDVVQRTLKTKFSPTQRKSDNNTKGMENLIEDEISDEELEAALKKVPAFYVQQFNLKKFHEMIPGLNATAQASPPQNGRSTPSTPEPPVIIRPANSVRSFNGIAKRAASQ